MSWTGSGSDVHSRAVTRVHVRVRVRHVICPPINVLGMGSCFGRHVAPISQKERARNDYAEQMARQVDRARSNLLLILHNERDESKLTRTAPNAMQAKPRCPRGRRWSYSPSTVRVRARVPGESEKSEESEESKESVTGTFMGVLGDKHRTHVDSAVVTHDHLVIDERE